MNIRKIALDLLSNIEKSAQYSNIALDNAITTNNLSGNDRSFLTVLVYGVIEHKLTIDYYIDTLSSLPPSKIEQKTRNILRLGIYQLKYLDKVPQYAAINESVNLSGDRSRGFVNAVLRQFMRTFDNIKLPDKNSDIFTYLSVKYSISLSLTKKFCDIFGAEKTESIFIAFSEKPPLTICVNTLKITRDELLKKLCDTGLSAKLTAHSKLGISLESASISELLEKYEGCFFVQDEASLLCVEATDAKHGQIIIDACACPGSKSFGMAINMGNDGKIHSFDLHENKLSLVNDSAKHLGINIIKTATKDSREFDKSLANTADRVLCDVPCSGYGIISKKPEIRYKNLEETSTLRTTQYNILNTNAKYLKAGGILVYSTCTLIPEENQLNIDKFLEENSDFSPLDFSFDDIKSKNGMLTLLPDEHHTDGFFIARMIKK